MEHRAATCYNCSRMALARDPETLKIPAFMRKRSLAARTRKPLILTALDRKKAGLPPEGLKTDKQKSAAAAKQSLLQPRSWWSGNWGDLIETKPTLQKTTRAVKPTKQKICRAPAPKPRKSRKASVKRAQKILVPEFSPPILDFVEPVVETAANKKSKKIGEITHYYDKIKVAVIKLSGSLCVGDKISYETADNSRRGQIVESMEINRQPVFKAGKGKEIGIKIKKEPKEKSTVWKN